MSYRSLAFAFRMGFSTVASIVKETTLVIWNTLQPLHMEPPTEEIFKEIAKDYYERWNFPHCIGAIDGKHIRIKCPASSGTMFYNYKHFFSIVLQAVADSHYRFITIDVGGFGKQSDGGTFQASDFYQLLQSGNLNIPPDDPLPSSNIVMPYVFLADEAYPLLKNILKPYARRQLDNDKEYFNARLSRARRCVECAFGILNAKWRILWKPIECLPETADIITKCVCVLHNTIIDKEGSQHLGRTDTEASPREVLHYHNTRPTEQAKLIRDAFKTFICTNKI